MDRKDIYLLSSNALEMARAFKPYQETPERAAIEAQIGIGYAILALVAKLDELTDTEADGSNPALRVIDPTGGVV